MQYVVFCDIGYKNIVPLYKKIKKIAIGKSNDNKMNSFKIFDFFQKCKVGVQIVLLQISPTYLKNKSAIEISDKINISQVG
jgi:hypothetical protein